MMEKCTMKSVTTTIETTVLELTTDDIEEILDKHFKFDGEVEYRWNIG